MREQGGGNFKLCLKFQMFDLNVWSEWRLPEMGRVIYTFEMVGMDGMADFTGVTILLELQG